MRYLLLFLEDTHFTIQDNTMWMLLIMLLMVVVAMQMLVPRFGLARDK